MTFAAAIGWSLLKSFLVTLAGTVAAVQIVAWLRGVSPRWRAVLWGLVLAPSLTPSLITGYCYRDTAMAMVHREFGREVLYTVIVAAQTIPIAALLIWFAPRPAVSASAVHCQTLLHSRNVSAWRLWLMSQSRSLLPAASILFLLSFQEADLASLMQTSNWTEWLFMRTIAGLQIDAAALRAATPALIQLPALLPILFWIGDSKTHPAEIDSPARNIRGGRVGAMLWTAVSLMLVVIIPLWQLARGARQGIGALWLQPSTWREISDAMLIAVTCGGLALTTTSLLLGRRQRMFAWRWRIAMLSVLMIPGLLGNLTLGLLLSALFQTPLLRAAYDSPAPLIIGQTLALIPRTAILWCCLSRSLTGTESHVLTLLQSSTYITGRQQADAIRWQLKGRLWFAAIILTCFWAYLEVLLPGLLAMPGLVPVSLVLYNSLHYGRISALAAKLVLALAVPLTAAIGALLIRRLIPRVRWS